MYKWFTACLLVPTDQQRLSEGRGYSGFQVTGMIEGFFWVSNHRIRDFFGWLDLSMDFWGIQNNMKIPGSATSYPGGVVLRITYSQIKHNILYHLVLYGNF